MTEQQYPMHAKLRLVSDKSQGIYEFLEWLGEKGQFIAQYDIVSDECRNCNHDDPHTSEIPGGGIGTRICGEEWCECGWNDRGNAERIITTLTTKEVLLAEYFEIDLKILEAEKKAMLDAIRALPKVKAADGEECTG